MKDYEALVVIPVAAVLTVLLLRWKAKRARLHMENYVKLNGLDAVVEKAAWIPPLRLWLNNRKSDAWCLLRYEDGSQKWARIRWAFGGHKVDLFD